MACSAGPDIPYSEHLAPGSFPLRLANLPVNTVHQGGINVQQVVVTWLKNFNQVIKNPSSALLSKLFLPESYWRDHLCLSWDFHTFQGPQEIAPYLVQSSDGCRIKEVALDCSSELRTPSTSAIGKAIVIQSFLEVRTDVGRGHGLVRLVYDEGSWKVYTLYTFLENLDGERPSFRVKPPCATLPAHEGTPEESERDEPKRGGDFDVLIIGAGQGGLTLAAHLLELGTRVLVIEKLKKVGDNWRNRYDKLVLHDPVWFDHLPFMPFPKEWPVYMPKNDIANWLETYAKRMNIVVWTEAELVQPQWTAETASWLATVHSKKDGLTTRNTVTPKHIVQATGLNGEPNFPYIPGIEKFGGSQLVHSSGYDCSVSTDGEHRTAIVVGCCNSGHDIAQDLHSNGYDVTIIQRSSTLVVGAPTVAKTMSLLYGKDSPCTEDADIIFQSIPNAVAKRLNIEVTAIQNQTDAKILKGLQQKGFALNSGSDDSGIWIKYLSRGGGYYFDVGCSSLIASGDIAIKSGVSVSSILPNGMKLTDGTELQADEIIFATGYQSMLTQCKTIFGNEIADQVSDVWGLDQEGEVRGIWRPSGHNGLWFMGGNLALSAFTSNAAGSIPQQSFT